MKKIGIGMAFCIVMFVHASQALAKNQAPKELWDRVEHHYADSNGVRIHYVALGQGPLIVMIHGFPDFWYTWRKQMDVLSARYRVVAVDQRGYDLSDHPAGVEQYAMPLLVNDIGAVIKAEGRSSAVIVGHDWGGAVAWTLAMTHPEWIQELIILNLPHPAGIAREIRNNPQQRKNSEYAFNFQKPGAEKSLSAEKLAAWVKDDAARAHYIDAFNSTPSTGPTSKPCSTTIARIIRVRAKPPMPRWPMVVPWPTARRPVVVPGPTARRPVAVPWPTARRPVAR